MSVITPTKVAGRPGGPYGRPSWLEIADPLEPPTLPLTNLPQPRRDAVLDDRVPSRRDSNG